MGYRMKAYLKTNRQNQPTNQQIPSHEQQVIPSAFKLEGLPCRKNTQRRLERPKERTAMILVRNEDVKAVSWRRKRTQDRMRKQLYLEPSHVVCLLCTNREVGMNGSARAMSDTCRKIQPLRSEGLQYSIFSPSSTSTCRNYRC